MFEPPWSVEDAVARVCGAYAAAVESACEAALAGGVCGVLVVRVGDDWLVGPHPLVPYGHRWEFSAGMDADTWAQFFGSIDRPVG